MTALAQFLRSPMMKPLGWTLVHFLWQGAVVGALLFGVLLLLRRCAAHARYLAACAALLVMAVSPVVTLSILTSLPDPVTTVRPGRADVAPIPRAGRTAPAAARTARFPRIAPRPAERSGTIVRLSVVMRRGALSQLLEAALPWLVAAWLSGILLLCLRLLGGWL